MKICVYASASEKIDKIYFKKAKELAQKMAIKHHSLVYGGGKVGLMGEMSRLLHPLGTEIIGIIPERLNQKGIVFENCTELVITKDMRERKHILDEKSDAVITLPGGFGTLEEISEMITGKYLGFNDKPLVILNINNFYDPLEALFNMFCLNNFAQKDCKKLYYMTSSIDDALNYIENYKTTKIQDKYNLK